MTIFRQLNDGWNAEPNAPVPNVVIEGRDVVVSFRINHFLFHQFAENDIGRLRFGLCSSYRLGDTNNEGWYLGQCRFSKIAPSWGEFFEISGNTKLSECPSDWIKVGTTSENLRHFLFYFRDETFECVASDWHLEIERPIIVPEPTTEALVSSKADSNSIEIVFRARG